MSKHEEEDLLVFPFDACEGPAAAEELPEIVLRAPDVAEPVIIPAARVSEARVVEAKPARPPAARSAPQTERWAEVVEQAPRPRDEAPAAHAKFTARVAQLEDVVSRFQIILEHTQGRLDDDIQRLRQTVDRLSSSVEDLTMSRDVVFGELGAEAMGQRLVMERAKGAARPRAQQPRYGAQPRMVEQGPPRTQRPPQPFGGRGPQRGGRRNAADDYMR